jgi:hypothetical protein
VPLGEIEDQDLTLEDLPAADADEDALQAFALTTNGYERMGSFEACAELAEAAIARWRATGELPQSLGEARCCLFFEQRRWRHYGYGFDDETLRYARELVNAMRTRLARPR